LINLNRRSDSVSEKDKIIDQLEYAPTPADAFIVNYLKDGYCDTAALKAVLADMDMNYRRSEGEAELRAIWALYRDSFRADTAEIAEASMKWFEMYHDLVPFESTKYLLEFVSKIDESFNPSLLLERVALKLVPTSDAEALKMIEDSHLSGQVESAIAQRRSRMREARPLSDLVAAPAHPEGWNPKDFLELDGYTDDAVFEWLSKANETQLLRGIATVMVRAQLTSVDSRPSVADKLRRVVKRLADRSALDRARAENIVFGIEKQGLIERGLLQPTQSTGGA
jgi:hypothetical protein